jgi:branched-chain amino acid aminotransferase
MTVFLHGRFVSEEQAVVSIFDRCFRYGDGLFEALLVSKGKMFRWPQHLARLERSAEFLRIRLPHSRDELFAFANELIGRNGMQEAVLRLQLSRGLGPRGYAPTGEEQPLVIMTLHPAPPRESPPRAWKLIVASLCVAAHDPLANHKTCSRLLQVVAAAEARERGADECLIVNTNGEVTEGSTSNVFWIERETVCTPPLGEGILPGVTRAAILECCAALGRACEERAVRAEQLVQSDGVFLSLTTRGIVEAESIDGKPLGRSPITERLRERLENLLGVECR